MSEGLLGLIFAGSFAFSVLAYFIGMKVSTENWRRRIAKIREEEFNRGYKYAHNEPGVYLIRG